MAPETHITPELYSLPDVCRVLRIGRSTVYQLLETDPSFPRRVKIARRAVRFRRAEIEQWVNSRPGQ